MDDIDPAIGQIRRFNGGAELALGNAWPARCFERGEAAIREQRAEAIPLHLLVGLIESPLHIGAAKIGDFAEISRELRIEAIGERPDEADLVARGAAPLELGDRAADAEIAAPFDIGLAGDLRASATWL